MGTAEPQGSAVVFDLGDISHALAQIARLQDGVKAEFDLIASRMSWLVIAESFIFSAFAVAISNYRPDHAMAGELAYLTRVLPCLGMLLAVCVYVAIFAAHSAVGTLKDERERMIARLPRGLRVNLISSRSRVQWWGNLPTHIIPPVLFLTWAGAVAYLIS